LFSLVEYLAEHPPVGSQNRLSRDTPHWPYTVHIMASFGMMNEAYFVGKKVLIDWVNNFLEINVEKVEQMANGAIYCNLWDAIHPGTIPMSRVDFTVQYEYDFTKNWKLMQNGFQKAGIDKMIPVQRLIKGRYQDNLEFMQWMYKYARDTYNGDPDDPSYDAIGRRSKSKGGREYTGSSKAGTRRPNRGSRPTSAASRGSTNTNNRARGNRQRGGGNGGGSRVNEQELQQLRDEHRRLEESVGELQNKCEAMQGQHDEIEKIAKDIENERDFYFNKVVAIENTLKREVDQDTPLLKAIYEILYQTEDDMRSASAGPAPQAGDQHSALQQQQQEEEEDVGM